MNEILLEISLLNKTLSCLSRVTTINITDTVIYKSNIGAYLQAKIALIDVKNPNKALLDNGVLIDKSKLFSKNWNIDFEKYKRLQDEYYTLYFSKNFI